MFGRGIGEISDSTADREDLNPRLRRAGKFLSTHLPEPDPKSMQLRAEIKKLAVETIAGNQRIRFHRDEEKMNPDLRALVEQQYGTQ